MKYYLIDIVDGIEPAAVGPFNSADLRDKAVKDLRASQSEDDALFWLDIDHKGSPKVGAYSAGFFGE